MKKLVYDVPQWHDTLYGNVKKTLLRLSDAIETAKEHYPEYDKFTQEIFSRMYSNDSVNKIENVPYWNEWAESAHSVMDELPEMEVLKSQVEYDPMLAGFSSALLAESVYKQLPHDCKAEDLEDLESQCQGMQDILSEIPEEADKSILEEALQKTSEQLEEKVKNLPNISDEKKTQMRAILRTAVKETTESIEQVKSSAKICGVDSSALDKDSNKQFVKMMHALMNDKSLLEIIEQAGKLINLYTTMKRKTPFYARTEVSGITMGNHIERALMSELLPEEVFAYKYVTNSLLEHEIKSRQDMIRGPVVVCIDASGSMNGAPETMAKATGLAIYNRMKAEKRSMEACLFNYDVVQTLTADTMIEFLSHRACGGTRIGSALTWAIEKVAQRPESDIIIITDGGIENVNEYIPLLKDIDVTSILISGSESDAANLKPISTTLIKTSSLEPETIFRKLNGSRAH